MTIIIGTNGNNTLNGTTGSDIITGGNGNDTIDGGNGIDVIDGGNGNDTLNGGAGSDVISGGNGSDTIDAGSGSDLVFAGNGNDLVIHRATGNAGVDAYDGGNGQDTLRLVVSNSVATSAAFLADVAQFQWQLNHHGSSTSYFSSLGLLVTSFEHLQIVIDSTVPIYGTNGDDVLMGTAGDDIIYGLDGNDVISSGPGNDYVDGGNGLDRANYANATTPITVMLAAGTVTIDSFTDTLRSIEFVRGGSANDSYDATGFSGSSTNAGSSGTLNEFEGMGGDDTITGNGNTRISYVNATGGVDVTLATGVVTGDGSVGTNSITGGVNAVRGSEFNDIIRGTSNNETLQGQGGDDQIGGGGGTDTLDGGTGFDTALYGLSASAVTVDLGAGTATGVGRNETLLNIEAVLGSTFNDTLRGNGGNNTLNGNGGDDQIGGGGGTDTLDGGTGFDTALYGLSASAVTVDLGAGTATGAGRNETLLNIEAVLGSAFNDTLRGNGGNNTLNGNGGDDQLGGGAGNDTLDGGAGFDTALYGLATAAVTVDLAAGTATGGGGNDTLLNVEAVLGSQNFGDTLIGNGGNNTLDGQGGNDVLQGGLGNDTLIGGAGIDIAVFSGLRSVYTFGPGTLTGPDGTDTTTGVELLQFDDAFMLGYALTPIDLSGFTLPNGNPIFGRAVADTLLIDVQASGRLIDLGADNDTLTLTEFGTPTYNLNILNVETVNSTGGIETVNLQNAASGLTVDLAGGFDTLNLANGTNTITTIDVEFVNGGSGDDTVTFSVDGVVTNQEVHLGGGTNVLNLAGAESTFVMQISGTNLTVNGQTDSGNEDITLLNVQADTTFDLGAGTDSITLWNDFMSVNVLTVENVESVYGSGFQSDQIHIAGNSAGATTVTGSGGADLMWASADVDRFRYTSTSDSPYENPFGGQRDVIHDFDAAEDFIVLDGSISALFDWEETTFGSTTIVTLDTDGDANWDMEIQLENLIGTLSSTNFLLE